MLEQAIEIANMNAIVAADQKHSYETIEDAYWAYSTNVEDTLKEEGLIEFYLEANEHYRNAWLELTGDKISYVHA